jgi:hypothetical protein
MATKKISDLTLASAVTDTAQFAGDDSSQTFRYTGAQMKSYIQAQIADLMKSSRDILNLGLAASVSGNALTIALKTLAAAADPSSTAPVKIGFRGTTAANGDSSLVSATAATSVVVSSGSTLGMTSAVEAFIYIYAINNAGTIELAVSRALYDDGSLVTTIAEGGAGAADSATAIYSTSARSSKAIRLIGRIKITEATAGTWASAPTELSVVPFERPTWPTVQRFTSGSAQTYTTPTPAPKYLKVKLRGGGGGGTGSGTTVGTAPTDGAASTFLIPASTTLGSAGGGVKGVWDNLGGLGGTNSVNAPGVLCKSEPGYAGGSGLEQGSSVSTQSPTSASTGFGGGPGGGAAGCRGASSTGQAAVANSGGGGGGAGTVATSATVGGSGGGSGGYLEIIVPNPGATYTYTVGAGGNAGAAGGGSNAAAGGAGAAGEIIVEEYY